MDASVRRVAHAPHELGGFERLNDPRHRRGSNLLGRRELAQRPRAAEDEDRQSRELRRRDAGRPILAADVPERVDCRRMKAVGNIG
jgi:hypothetical protein